MQKYHIFSPMCASKQQSALVHSADRKIMCFFKVTVGEDHLNLYSSFTASIST